MTKDPSCCMYQVCEKPLYQRNAINSERRLVPESVQSRADRVVFLFDPHVLKRHFVRTKKV
jgi:hypothetical protein